MFGTLRIKSTIQIITTRFTFLIVAGMLFFWGGSVNLIKMMHPMKFSDLTEENMNGAYVSDDVVFLYGEYMATDRYEDGQNKGTSSVSMIINPNETNYIGLQIPKMQIPAYEDALDECLDNWNDKDWILENPFHVSGTVVRMGNKEFEYYKDYAGKSYSEPDFMPYVLKIDYLGNTKRSEAIFITVFGLIFLSAFIIGLVKALSGMYQKPIRQFISRQNNPAYEKDKLEAAWLQAVNIGDMYAMKEYVIFMHGAISRIVRPWDIVWIYKTVTKHRTNGIPSGKSYAITLAMSDGKQYALSSNKKSSDDMIASIKRELPGAIIGYSEELNEKYKTDRTWFSHNWDEIRNTEH